MEVSKNSSFIYKVYKIGPISNISKEKLEPGAKVEDWALSGTLQKGHSTKNSGFAHLLLPDKILIKKNIYCHFRSQITN